MCQACLRLYQTRMVADLFRIFDTKSRHHTQYPPIPRTVAAVADRGVSADSTEGRAEVTTQVIKEEWTESGDRHALVALALSHAGLPELVLFGHVNVGLVDRLRGSALECAACLDELVAKKRIASADEGKAILVRIVSMLVGLIRSTSASRVHEDPAAYGAGPAQ